MSEERDGFVNPYEEAFETLGLTPDVSPKDIKRAYRRAAVDRPPDRDPDGFRRVREAYELLSHPEDALEIIAEESTAVPVPSIKLPEPVELGHALPLAAMRAAVAKLDVVALLGDDDDR